MGTTEDKKEEPLEEVDDLQMSRGEKPDINLKFSKLRDVYVYDEGGNPIKFGDIYKHQKTIVVFTRHFLCFICKDYVEDLALIPLEYLQEANVRLVVIGPAPCKFIKTFKKETGYLYTMYTDPERVLYKALQLKETPDYGSVKDHKHLKNSMFMGILKSTWRAMQVQEYAGDVKQQGGAFILGPGDNVDFIHIDQTSTGQIPINELLKAAGVHPVSFPKDPRVFDV